MAKGVVVGIDPGKKGGFVCIERQASGRIVIVEMETMPFAGDELDVMMIAKWFELWEPEFIFLERVASMPRDGAMAAFAFGKQFGALLALLKMAAFPHELVAPAKWQGMVHEDRAKVRDPKQRSLMAVRRLFPQESFLLPRCRVPHDGLVDAACIAWAGLRLMTIGSNLEDAKVQRKLVGKEFDERF